MNSPKNKDFLDFLLERFKIERNLTELACMHIHSVCLPII